jgi:hypothetical protein
LQAKGYIIRFDLLDSRMFACHLLPPRWVTYSKGGFKEGVSLTINDELNRWQKYSYGEWPLFSFYYIG